MYRIVPEKQKIRSSLISPWRLIPGRSKQERHAGLREWQNTTDSYGSKNRSVRKKRCRNDMQRAAEEA